MTSVEVMAHRGDSGNAPENTLVAFRQAIEMGADWIELDVHLTQDGILVVMHDPTVDRTTSGKGAVADMTYAEIQALDAGSWFDAAFRGERVPSLQDALELNAQHTRWNIEIKAPSKAAGNPAQKVLGQVHHMGIADRCLISSFDESILLEVHMLDKSIATAIIGSGTELLDKAAATSAQMINPNKKGVDAQLVTEAHHHGLMVNVWPLDEPEEMRRYIDMGVDIITTNFPARLLKVLGRT